MVAEFSFEVEKILKKRKVKGEEQFLVKYLFYPGNKIFSISFVFKFVFEKIKLNETALKILKNFRQV